MRTWIVIGSLVIATVMAVDARAAESPAQWAHPITRAGLPNLARVSPTLYRGAQPEKDGLAALPALGITTVVNLRSAHSDRPMLAGTGLRYEELPLEADGVRVEDVIRFLRLATAPWNGTVFVHCKHGADRTGVMIAAYRVVVQNWSKDEALREMVDGGFGFHTMYTNLVQLIRDLDVESVRRAVATNQNALTPAR